MEYNKTCQTAIDSWGEEKSQCTDSLRKPTCHCHAKYFMAVNIHHELPLSPGCFILSLQSSTESSTTVGIAKWGMLTAGRNKKQVHEKVKKIKSQGPEARTAGRVRRGSRKTTTRRVSWPPAGV